MTAVVVMAKACLPGRVKTRLSPPYSPADAARIAAASLADTLAFVAGLPVQRRILAFDGERAPAIAGFEVIAQPGGGLDVRIAAALDVCDQPALVIGMDTPQLRVGHVRPALAGLERDDRVASDAWLGPATDGGFWALAIRRPRSDLVRGVPMSRADTGARQRERLEDAGLRVEALPTLTDLDDASSLAAVLAHSPRSGSLHRLFAAADRPRPVTT